MAGVSWEVHKVLASAADPFEVIAHPPPNERTGRRAWDGDAAKRAVGWKASVPVTVEEKVEAVTELVRDEAVACRVAVALLKRRRVVFVAMRDGYPDYGLAGWPAGRVSLASGVSPGVHRLHGEDRIKRRNKGLGCGSDEVLWCGARLKGGHVFDDFGMGQARDALP